MELNLTTIYLAQKIKNSYPTTTINIAQFFPWSQQKEMQTYLYPPEMIGPENNQNTTYSSKIIAQTPQQTPTTPWSERKPVAVFRGASTGCGTAIETNQRLKLSLLSVQNPKIIDAGITKWNLRSRKVMNSPYLQTINLPYLQKLGIHKVNSLTPDEQSQYKYIIHVDGHVSAFRLGRELNSGSCLIIADSPYWMWFRKMLVPYEHYVPVKHDLSDLVKQINWCINNDKKCEEIAQMLENFTINIYKKMEFLTTYNNSL